MTTGRRSKAQAQQEALQRAQQGNTQHGQPAQSGARQQPLSALGDTGRAHDGQHGTIIAVYTNGYMIRTDSGAKFTLRPHEFTPDAPAAVNWFKYDTDIARTANAALASLGHVDGLARIRENKAACRAGRPAWDLLHKAQGMRAGRVVFTIISTHAGI